MQGSGGFSLGKYNDAMISAVRLLLRLLLEIGKKFKNGSIFCELNFQALNGSKVHSSIYIAF